jgi:hypothetical protein
MPYGRRGSEFVVNAQLTGMQLWPSIAGFASGGFIVVWGSTDPLQDGAGYAIKAQRFDSLGNAVGAEFLVNSAAAGDQRAPSVTTLASGGYVVTWETADTAQDGSGTAIKGQLFDSAGAAVGAEFRVNSQLTADQIRPSITGLESGGFVVTWQTADSTQDGHTTAIKGQIYSAAGTAVGTEFLVNTGAVGAEMSPSVTSLTGGGFVATWTLGSGTSADIYAQVFAANGAKSGGQFRVNSTTPFNQDFASVTELSDGRFVVTWSSSSSLTTSDNEIRARIFSASGTPVGNDFVVSTTKVSSMGNFLGSTNPQVLHLPDGGFLVTWSLGSGDYINSSIRGQYFDAGGARLGSEFLVSTVADRAESNPDIAIDGNGNLFAVWTSANTNFTDYDIRGQVYTPSGAPEIVSNGGGGTATLSVAENQTAVTTVAASDPEGSALTYSIVGGIDSSRFAINASTGVLTFIQARNFEQRQDFDNNNVYEVVVSASDGVNTDIQALAVTITNVNEGVTLTGGQPYYYYIENGTAAVADFNATDADGDPVTYSLSGADAARFTIDSAGLLRFAASPNFEARLDAGANNIYDVTVSASDGSLSSSYSLSVEVLNQNEAPYIVSGGGGDSFAMTLPENTGFVMTIVTADPDASPSSVTYSIVGGADASKFVIQSQTGQLFFTSGRNFEAPSDVGANNVYDVIVSVSDGFNPADTQAIAVTITNVNEAPIIGSNGAGASANITVAENGLAVTTVAATDPDGTVPTYSIAGGADAALFTIDAATGALRFAAAPNFEAPADSGANNVYNVIVAANDGGLSDTQALAITVSNVNEDIILAPLGAFSVGENGTAVGTISASDPEGAPINYSIVGGADAALFAIDAATGALRFVSAPNFEAPGDAGQDNVYEVTVAAGDGVFVHTQVVSVTVVNVNEGVTVTSDGGAAAAALTVPENGLAVTTVAAADADGTSPTYAIVGGADAGFFTIDSTTGALSFVSPPDFEAPGDADSNNIYELVVAASDGSLSDSQAISVTVSNANEGVAITSGAAWSTVENGSAIGTVTAADMDGTAPIYAIVGGADAARFSIDSATGALTFVSAPDFEAPADAGGDNVYDVIVSASDGTFTDSEAIAVTVGNANEGVTITSDGGGASASLAVTENGVAVTILAATDADGTSPSYAIVGGADAALFAIDAATGALRFVSTPDFETPADADGDNVYEVIVEAGDGILSDTQAISVTVGNANEGVIVTSGTAFSTVENNSAVGTVTAVDTDGTAPTYAIAGGADSARFTIDATTGAISFVSAPDFELPGDADGDNIYDVIVSASDGSFTDTQALTVTVGDANEGVTIVSGGGGASAGVTMVENGTAVAAIVAVDGDGASPAYAIAGGADSALFTIDAATGALSFVSAPDFEAPTDADGDNIYQVVVSATDGSFTDTQAVSVTVANADEPIVFTSSTNVVRAENGDASHQVAAVDLDGPGPAISYSIAGGADSARFWIDSATGLLTYIGVPDHEAPSDSDGDNVYEILVQASDGIAASTQAISFTISDVNEAPRIVSNGGGTSASLGVNEGQTAVATIVAVDGEGSSVTYSIVGGADAALFAIDAATGALNLIAAPDYEAPIDAFEDNFYTVIVAASDGELSSWQSVQIAVANVNEGLSITSGAAYSIVENGNAVATMTAVDQDGTAPVYSIAGGADAALFAIDAATGALRFLAAPDFESPIDAGGNNVYDVVVAAGDGSFTDTRAVAVTVTNANDLAPVIGGLGNSVTLSLPEGVTSLIDLDATDGEGDSIAYSLSGADSGLFAIDAATGAVRFIAPPNFEAPGSNAGTNSYALTVTANDGLLSDTLAITVNVGNVNEGLAITSSGGGAGAALSVAENGVAVATVVAADVDGTAPAYSIVGGADAGLFAIDASTGALRFLSAPNFEARGDSNGDNVYDVVVAASDGSFTDTQALAVSVTNVNEEVTIISNFGGTIATLQVAENSLAVDVVAARDADGGAVVYSISGGADAALFTIDPVSGAVSFRSAPNYEAPGDSDHDNIYTLIVSASDGVFSDEQGLTVYLQNVNEGVTITSGGGGAAAAYSVAENGLAVTNVAATDIDGTPVTYAIAGGADSARFAIDSATGALRFLAAPNFEAPADAGGNNVYDVIVSASDGTFSDTQALAVTVTNVNEGVTITSGGGGSSASVSVAENSLAVTNVAALDADGGAVTYAIVGGADAPRFTIDAATGALRFVSAPNFEGPTDAGANNVYDVIVSASDGSFSDTQALAVTVTNVREGNTITGTSANNTISTSSTVSGQPLATELEDTIYGLGGADTITSAGGADIVDGGAGNDIITGGLGADILTGGTGADRFTYNAVAETQVGAGRDVITDFSRAEADKISLNAIDANVNQGGNQNFTFIGAGAFTGIAGQLRFEQVGGNTFVSGDVNGDGIADFQIELTGPVTLISTDFIL